MALFEVNGELYEANSDERYRVFVNQGGTSSGKTYCLMQLLLTTAIQEARAVITVVGQDLPNLKVGALRDTQNIIAGSEFLTSFFVENRSEHSFRGRNGSLIEFKSYDGAQDAKSGKRDYLFVNEANGITFEVYWQLAIRTRKKVYLDYNPNARFWVHDEVIGREGVKLIISDHRHNHFLTEEEHAKIEGIQDPELWKVYARGLTGRITGLILTNWDIVDRMPAIEDCKMQAWGLDFGFTNDPSALEEVRLAHGDLWVQEWLYETGLTNPAIAKECKAQGMTRQHLIIADSAEPKSIEEIRQTGLWIVGAPKGADSINAGIDILRRYKIHFVRGSKGIIDNAKKYKWKTDRDGKRTNVPIDEFNHGIDAIRYVALAKLGIRRNGTAKAHTIKQD